MVIQLNISKETNLVPSEFFGKKGNLNLYKRSEDLYQSLVKDQHVSIKELLKDLSLKDRIQVLALTMPRFTFFERRYLRLKNTKDQWQKKDAASVKKSYKKARANTADPLPAKLPAISKDRRAKILNYLKGQGNKQFIANENYLEVLQAIKIIDIEIGRLTRDEREGLQLNRTSYALRKRCLEVSRGKLPTFIAFTKSFEDDEEMIRNPKSRETLQRVGYPRNYVAARQGLQGKILSRIFIDTLYMSRKFNEVNPERAAIFALGGNCGAGKTHMAKKAPELSRLIEDPQVKQTFSPDNAKRFLRYKAKGVSDDMVHTEGCKTIYGNLQNELLGKATHLSLVIDKLLQDPVDLAPYVAYAKKNNKNVIFKDIDCPLILSCLRVLARDTNTEPCMTFNAVEKNFTLIRDKKASLVEFIKTSPQVVNYELFAFDVASGKSGLAAQKKGVEFTIVDEDLHRIALSGRPQAEQEGANVRDQKITLELIEQYKQFGIKAEGLQSFMGMTIEKALARKSVMMPKW